MFDGRSGGQRRLLVVEDDADLREHVAEVLETEDYEVEVAVDGDDALSILHADPSFDLIVLDLMLPNMDGWQFRLAQRARPMLSAIPVVAMSASTSAQARAIDADAYVAKPFEPEALLAVVRQVLDQRRSSELERLTSLGRMAAGIAHEINNPLTYIYASLSMGQAALDRGRRMAAIESHGVGTEIESAIGSIETALEGVDRVRAIMNGIRLFIQAPDERRGPVDVRDVIESSLAVFDHEIRQKTLLEKSLNEVPVVLGNAGQLGQLVINLLTNALDSIPAGSPESHRLAVRTRTSERGEAIIEVSDTGSGMSEGTRNRIFEPFFTTKPPGLGAGLGLSICHGIVRGHGGSIEVETLPGKGSSFRIRLPAIEMQGGPRLRPARRQKLLIVDDDPRVGDALARLFRELYDVSVVRDGDAAVGALERGERPDVILCDFLLGATTGEDVYRRLRKLDPRCSDRIVFMTGAVFTESARRFLDEVPNPCLEKPFTPEDFEKALERLHGPVRGASRTRLRAESADESVRIGSKTRARERP